MKGGIDMYLSDLYSNISHSISASVGKMSQSLGDAVAPLFWAAIGVYIVYQAWNIIYTQNEVIISEVIKTVGSLSLVSAFCFKGSLYMNSVVPFFQELGPNLSAYLTDNLSEPTNMIEQYWSSYNPIFQALDMRAQSISWYDFPSWGSIIFSYFFTLLSRALIVLVLTINLIIASFMLNLNLTLGLIFIPMFFFPATRNFFQLWIGQVMNYVFLSFLYVLASNLVANFLLNRVKEVDPRGEGIGVFVDELIIMTIIFVYLINQISSVAQGLSGGLSVNTVGMGVGRALNSIGNSARGISGISKGMKSLKNLFSRVGNIGKAGAS